MINEKIPQRARNQWPLLSSNGEILWVPGHQMSERIRLRKGNDGATLLKFQLISP
jgi:hypothetical protein